MDVCPVCGEEADHLPTRGDRTEVVCPRCGKFEVSGTAERVLEIGENWTQLSRATLSHLIRQDQQGVNPPRLNSNLVQRVKDGEVRLPSPAKQASNLLRYVAENFLVTGKSLEDFPPYFEAIIGALDNEGAYLIAKELVEIGLLAGADNSTFDSWGFAELRPTLAGWKEFEREKISDIARGAAIIAMKFGDNELDRFVDQVVKPAVVEAGYEVERVSDRPRAGVIDQVMRMKIRDAPFVLADLTHDNNGAYWEAGFAEGLGKPVVYLCREDKWNATRSHFDTNHCETVTWAAEQADDFRERLVAVIRNSMIGK